MTAATPVLVVGAGPAGLMAATALSENGANVLLCEKQKALGRKLLIAGGSGLNVSSALPLPELLRYFEGPEIDWLNLFKKFSVADWLEFLAKLGLKTFKGTSNRYFVEELKATNLLKRWLEMLEGRLVQFKTECEVVALRRENDSTLVIQLASGEELRCAAVVLALGGASWLAQGDAAMWTHMFSGTKINLKPFTPANCGFSVAWKPEFLSEVGRQPLKNVELQTTKGSRKGDMMITDYGVEGTPVYAVGETGLCFLDLKPDLSAAAVAARLGASGEKLSPLRRAVKALKLDAVRTALLFHHSPSEALASTEAIAVAIKKFPLVLREPRPLSEAISSRGGIALSEVDEHFMLKKIPGVFVAGEMLDWHAPTGGFLIQACVSQGYVAGNGALKFCQHTSL